MINAVGHSRQNQQNLSYNFFYAGLYRLNELVHYPLELFSTTCIRIVILDTNDNAPIFDLPTVNQNFHFNSIYSPLSTNKFDLNEYHLYLPEDLPEGTYLTTLRAHDLDIGSNSLIKFSLFGKQESMSCFYTDQLSGVVRLASGCDLSKSKIRQHNLTAWAMDHGNPQLSNNLSFVVHIIPVRLNSYPPRFLGRSTRYSAWIKENLPIGTYVLKEYPNKTKFQLIAIDPEGSDVHYNIISGTGFGKFVINNDGKFV